MHERVLLVEQKVNKSGVLERKLMEEKTYQTPCGTIHYWNLSLKSSNDRMNTSLS